MHSMPIIITGFLPNRSEARPQKIPVKAWLKEKTAEVLIGIRGQHLLFRKPSGLYHGLTRRGSWSSSCAHEIRYVYFNGLLWTMTCFG